VSMVPCGASGVGCKKSSSGFHLCVEEVDSNDYGWHKGKHRCKFCKFTWEFKE